MNQRPSPISFLRSGLLACLLPVCLAGPLLGQGPTDLNRAGEPADLKVRGASVEDVSGLLEARDREALHPGGALQVVGNEEGDNGFRHRTPLLEGAEKVGIEVDTEKLRERRLAMYTTGASFHSPAPRRAPDWDDLDGRAQAPARSSGDLAPGSEEPGYGDHIGVMLLFGVAVGVACVTLRGRA